VTGPADSGARAPPHRPRRRFAQNFLHDRGVIARIIAAIGPHPGGHIVEIGPGLGALTAPLLERAGSLDVIELDRDLAQRLDEEFGGRGLRVRRADVLAVDFRSLAHGEERLRVVGNLPYNISTPVLFHLLGQRELIDDMHFMLQREVVERIVAGPGSRVYGRLSVMIRFACEAQKLFDVGAGAFRPAPRVASALLRLRVRRAPPVAVTDPALFAATVARCFAQRRKTLRNSLRAVLDQDSIRDAGVDPGARPETLDLEAFAALANRIGRGPG